jgi:hypothetical protein
LDANEGMWFSLHLQHHLYYCLFGQVAHSQIFGMLMKELGLDSQSAEGMLILSLNGHTLHQHQNPTVVTILEAL